MDFVCYKDFGAKGDGVTNDFFAIQAAHDYANEHGLPVKAEAGKSYLIGNMELDGVARTISVKTDTDWCGATIIIDDTDIAWVPGSNKNYSTNVFTVESDYPNTRLPDEYVAKINAEGGLDRDKATKVGDGLGYPAMLVMYNDKTRHFIRFGCNENSGSPQRELVLIDENGNIDPTTPLLFSFTNISYAVVVRTDVKPISIGNATVISRASRVNLLTEYHSISRGIQVSRPNTTVKNLKHVITGELLKYQPVDRNSNPVEGYTCDWKTRVVRDKDGNEVTDGSVVGFIGHSYGGFIVAHNTHNILIENVTFQARVYYLQGTYDLTMGQSNAVTLVNCDQSNFLSKLDPEHPNAPGMGRWWGVMGSNFCKNLVYDRCRLTRYDAHCGVVNGKILNSEVAVMTLTGGGNMLIENSTFYTTHTLINMRSDYGCTWNGDITVKNCKIIDALGRKSPIYLISVSSANHWFGYPTHFPSITIDNLEFEAEKDTQLFINDHKNSPDSDFFYRSVTDPNIHVEGGICTDGRVNENVYTPPRYIKVINNEKNGYKVQLWDVPFFENTELIGVEKIKPES